MNPRSVSAAAGVEVEVAEAAVALGVAEVEAGVSAAAEGILEAVAAEAPAWAAAVRARRRAVPGHQGGHRMPISAARPALDLIPAAAIVQTSAKAISVPGHRQARALETALVSIPVRGPKLVRAPTSVRDPTSVAVLVRVIDQALARVLASATALVLVTDRV